MNKDQAGHGLTPEELKPEDWAGEMGLKWLASLSLFEEMIAPIGGALLDRADYRDGEKVIDLGCGGGATTLAIAQKVAPTGKVMGVDISPDLVAAARERAVQSGAMNIAFFDEPIRAFSHLHGLLRKGGRIDLAVWGPPRDNLWMMAMMGVVRNHIEVPPAVPRAPGPFAFEDLEYLGEVMDGSGFTKVDVVAYDGLQPVGGIGATPEKAVEFAFNSLAVGRLLNDKSDAIREAASKELADVFARHHVPGKGVMMQGKAWLVSAIA